MSRREMLKLAVVNGELNYFLQFWDYEGAFITQATTVVATPWNIYIWSALHDTWAYKRIKESGGWRWGRPLLNDQRVKNEILMFVSCDIWLSCIGYWCKFQYPTGRQFDLGSNQRCVQSSNKTQITSKSTSNNPLWATLLPYPFCPCPSPLDLLI